MQTTDCRTAVQLLAAYAENPGRRRAEIDAAISHIRECPHCRSRVGHLVRALATDEEDLLTCEECEDRLPDFVLAETEGRAKEAKWRSLCFHIETCPSCSAAYSELAELVGSAHGEQVEEPLDYPVPDLSFLHREASDRLPVPDPNWYQVALDSGLAWLERKTGQWRRLQLSLPALGGEQQEAPVLAGLMGDTDVSPPAAKRTLAPSDAHFELKLVLGPDTEAVDKGLYRLDVALTLRDRFGDFSGAQVALQWGDTARVQETDALGKVTFAGLSGDQLASMSLTVTLPD